MDANRKKELLDQYKLRLRTGGVFAIRNTVSDRLLLQWTTDLPGSKNQFLFHQKFGSAASNRIKRDWDQLGADAFEFVVLEEIIQKETQTEAEFAGGVKARYEFWREKLSGHSFY